MPLGEKNPPGRQRHFLIFFTARTPAKRAVKIFFLKSNKGTSAKKIKDYRLFKSVRDANALVNPAKQSVECGKCGIFPLPSRGRLLDELPGAAFGLITLPWILSSFAGLMRRDPPAEMMPIGKTSRG